MKGQSLEIFAIRRFFAYFGNFSLRMRSFDYITAAGLKSNFIFEFIEPSCPVKKFLPPDAAFRLMMAKSSVGWQKSMFFQV